MDVITGDTSTLRDRALAFAVTSSPYIITAFAGPKAAESFYEQNWRWAFGAFAIIVPIVALPLFFILQVKQREALRDGRLQAKVSSGRTILESMKYYFVEFDGESL